MVTYTIRILCIREADGRENQPVTRAGNVNLLIDFLLSVLNVTVQGRKKRNAALNHIRRTLNRNINLIQGQRAIEIPN